MGATPPVAAAQQCWQEETALPSASTLTTVPIHCHCLGAAIFKKVTRLSDHILSPSSLSRGQEESRELLTVLEIAEWTSLLL